MAEQTQRRLLCCGRSRCPCCCYGFAIYRFRSEIALPAGAMAAGGGAAQGKIDPRGGSRATRKPSRATIRQSSTTVKEYRFKPAEKLPAVKGIAALTSRSSTTRCDSL